MGFWKTILGIARNRLIGPPVVVLALGVAALVFVLTPVTYVSSSLLVLTTPSAGGLEDPNRPGWTTNPLLQFNDGLKTTAAILIQAAGTRDALTKMGAGPGSPAKVVINDGTSNGKVMTASQTGPFIFVQVTSTREDSVTGIVRNAEQYLRTDLINRQRTLGAPKQTYLMLTDVVPASPPQAKMTQKWEFAGAAFGAIVCMGFGIAYLVIRRRSLRAAAAETPYDFYYGSVKDAAPLRPAALLSAGSSDSSRRVRRYDPSAWEDEDDDSPSKHIPPLPLSRNGTRPAEQNGHPPSDITDYGLPLDADPAETVHDHPRKRPHPNTSGHDVTRDRESGHAGGHDRNGGDDQEHERERESGARQGTSAFGILDDEAAAREREAGDEPRDAPAPRVR
ncbi:hypothetical protein [Actinomadura gamaensis]|uniref:Capsular polysaccharide biosynthesis protein n=1 Tax=Actinomadura gamaensis TaxID=1763541 RepID=A0ABV9TZA8_9ACTN